MSFDLDSLFDLEPQDSYKPLHPNITGPDLARLFSDTSPPTSTAVQKDSEDLEDALGDAQLMFDDRIAEVVMDRDQWKIRAEESAQCIETLEKRVVHKLARDDASLSARLNKLEKELQRYKTENNELKKEMINLEKEIAILSAQNDGNTRKLRGANKKVKNKENARAKEEEKAKDAVYDKNQRLKSERDMRKELRAAQAEVAKQEKIIEGLRADLHIERAGYPHLQEDGTAGDLAIVAFSVHVRIHRSHFQKIRSKLENTRASMTSRVEAWYARMRKPQDQEQAATDTRYIDTPKKSFETDSVDDEYEVSDDSDYTYIQTGAEHDGWRSKRGLEAVSRQAMADYNYSD